MLKVRDEESEALDFEIGAGRPSTKFCWDGCSGLVLVSWSSLAESWLS